MEGTVFADIRARHKISAGCQPPDFAQLEMLSHDAVCLRLLAETINCDWAFEQWIVAARGVLLDAYRNDRAILTRLRPLLVALAHQGFNNEYVSGVTSREAAVLDEIDAAAVWAPTPGNLPELEWAVLIRGLYRPLVDFRRAHVLLDVPRSAFSRDISPLISRTLKDPIEEARLGDTVPSFGSAGDAVSAAVQAQYEQCPYPRWLRLTPIGRSVEQQARKLRPEFAWPVSFRSAPLQLLVAGCGTGHHPLRLAVDNPDAEILAFDFSRPALGHALRMAREAEIQNVTFLHGDLLSVRELGRRFHHIECGGVLHHIQDHGRAWTALTDVLHTAGTLKVGVYNKVARMALDHLRSKRPRPTGQVRPDDVRRMRRELIDDPACATAVAHLVTLNDFFTTSMTTYILSHVFEHHYTVNEVEQIASTLGLELVGVSVPKALRLRIEAREPVAHWPVVSFDRWKQIEWAYAGTEQMFQFWLQKPSRDAPQSP